MQLQDRKKVIFIIISLVVLVIGLGFSFAWLRKTLYGEKDISVAVGTIDLHLDETSENGISLIDKYPVYDDIGKTYDPYTFSIINKSKIGFNYKLSLAVDFEALNSCTTTSGAACELLDGRNIRYELKSGDRVEVGTLSDSYTIDYGMIGPGEENKIDYELRLWLNIDANNDAMGKVFFGNLEVLAMQALDELNQGNDNVNEPEMDDNMIAVKYDGYDWVKTDKENGWYNYDRQMWANAVTVTSATLDTYKNASIGTKISMNDIETMWVWIPRYSYAIAGKEDGTYYGKQGIFLDSAPTKALPGEISVKFIGKDEKDTGTAKYLVSEEPKNFRTPDAFTFNGKELSGFWVGKFETSSSDPSADYGGGNTTSLAPMIKPNVTSWRGINISNIHNVSTSVTAEGNRYGFTSMNSHAMKNDEWGAVAYLSQSKYGKLGNEIYKGAYKEVFINNNSNYITGCSAGEAGASISSECLYTYDVTMIEETGKGSFGAGASTTGSIYGVYDMSGGSWEYVMANYNDTMGSSGLTTMPESFYYNKYTSLGADDACEGGVCFSHALTETAGWYNDSNAFVTEQMPWSLSGGSNSSNASAGIFYYYHGYGSAYTYITFRLVMSK